jgi:SAM-dependent methyltransferase
MAKEINKKAKYTGSLTLEVLEGADKYNQWIFESISPYLNSTVLEIGSGIGNISSFIKNKDSITLTDIEPVFLTLLKKKFNIKNYTVRYFDITKDPNKTNINKYNTVFGINVLEHIEDDVAALTNLKKLINKSGNLVLLVPAKKKAYNKLDKNLGHFRRYEKNELILKLNKAGYTIIKIQYFNALGLLSWVVRNYISNQDTQLSKKQVALFDNIVPLLKIIEKYIRVPIGISLIVVARPK